MKKIGIGKSHGKLILVGEHAVVYGVPAIAIPLPQIGVIVQCQGQGTITHCMLKHPIVELTSVLYHGDLELAPDQLENIRQLIWSFFDFVPEQQAICKHLTMTIKSQLPYERGMGSSAATATAIIRALMDYFELELPLAVINQLVNREEQLQHGNPSGLDALVVQAKIGYYFQKKHAAIPLNLTLPGYLLIVDSGVTGRTGDALKKVAALKKENPQFWQAEINKISLISRRVKALLTASKYSSQQQLDFGNALNDNQLALQKLGISIPKTDQLIATLRDNGALGAKITGGGLGGCVFGYFTDLNAAQVAAAAISEPHWLTSLTSNQ